LEQPQPWQTSSVHTTKIYTSKYDNVTKVLQKQIINAVKPDFIVHLEDEFSRYNNVKVNGLLDYLFMVYGTITSTDLIENHCIFDQEWDTSRPFQTVLAQVKQCCDYTANGDQPYTSKQILVICLQHWTLPQCTQKMGQTTNHPENLCGIHEAHGTCPKQSTK
jgi:hypothetical protein